MRKRVLLMGQVLCAVCLVFSGTAGALGLGPIELRSGLNQHIDARISFVGVKSGDLDNLRVALADTETFEAAGLVRSAVLLELKFTLEGEGEGSYVQVRSKNYFKEPAVEFIVEVSWSGGRILREYALILE